ncbi:rCG24996 [Rattus norvegicus]|uniref:RCG24996 n=1 Tax=Rattus norvegicus TaxID=10116 RepID=A6KFF9_RAT|nr:rCG24996 [Rattus norvegicus]
MSRLLVLEVVTSTEASSNPRSGSLLSAVPPTTPEGVASQALPLHFRNFDRVLKPRPQTLRAWLQAASLHLWEFYRICAAQP